jgi:predicted MFS family arabinose efflux permease
MIRAVTAGDDRAPRIAFGVVRLRRRGLLLHRDFLLFWGGESVSLVGDQVSRLAIPLVAVLGLGATEEQMGLLGAAGTLPFLVFGLLAGVWVDRVRRRPLLIGVDLAYAALIGSIPLTAVLGKVSLAQLFIVEFGAGALGVVGTAGYQAFIPTLVGRRRIVDANSRLEISNSAAIVIGPGLAGVLVQVLSAPIAVAVDALSFLVSAAALLAIRKREPAPAVVEHGTIVGQIREGLAVVLGDARLRLIMACGATHNFFLNGWQAALLVLFMVRLGLTPAAIGLVFAAAGPGVLCGALLAGRLPRYLGLGPTIAHMQVLTGVSALLVASASLAPASLALVPLVVGEFLWGLARPVFNVNQLSLRQTITPDRLLGRMNASIRFLMWVATPVGAVFGGVVASMFGLPQAMTIAAVGGLAAAIWVYLPAVWKIKEQPRMPRAT